MNHKIQVYLFLIAIALLSVIGCGKKKTNAVIDVDPFINNIKKEVMLSNYFSRIENIPLETTKESFIKSTDKVSLIGNIFYIMDRERKILLQFTRQGKFIRQIGSVGKGPGEFIDINDFAVNTSEGLIFILSNNSRKLLKYNLEGKFLKEYTLNHYPLTLRLSHDSTGLYLFSPPQILEKAFSNQFRHYSFDGVELSCFHKANITESQLRASIPVQFYQLYYYKSDLYYYDEFYHRLTIINKNLEEEYIDFCINGEKFDSNNEQTVENSAQTGTVDAVVAFGENMFIQTLKEYRLGTIIYNTETKEGFNVVFDYDTYDHGLYNDLDGGCPVWPRGLINDSTMFTTFTVHRYKLDSENSEYLRDQKVKDPNNQKIFKQMMDTLDINSNPVIQLLYK